MQKVVIYMTAFAMQMDENNIAEVWRMGIFREKFDTIIARSAWLKTF